MSSLNSSAAAKVFIFGVTGKLGSAAALALTSAAHSSHFQVTAAVRPATLESKDESKSLLLSKLKSSGVQFVSGDVDKADAATIAGWMGGQDVVLSFLFDFNPAAQFDEKLLAAVQQAKAGFFVPSIYTIDIDAVKSDVMPLISKGKAFLSALRASGVSHFTVSCGIFMEYAASHFNGVDVENGVITAPYSLSSKFTTIAMRDIAALVAEALLHRTEAHVRNRNLYFGADTLTYSQLQELLEAKLKRSLKAVVMDKASAEAVLKNGNGGLQEFSVRMMMLRGEQHGISWDIESSFNAQHAKHIPLRHLQEFVQNM